jgi:hypothetical protein
MGTLLLSILPNILFQEITGGMPNWLFGAKLTVIAVLLFLSLFWAPARSLQRYFLVFLVIVVADLLGSWLASLPQWQAWLSTEISDFVPYLLGDQLVRMIMAAVIIVGLLLIGFRRGQFFLRLGELNAPAPPWPEVGVNKPSSWRLLGVRLSLLAFFVLLLVIGFFYSGRVTLDAVWAAAPLLPLIILFAGTNSLYEEIAYRAALLAPIHRVLGKTQAVLLTAAFFGIGHFYGVPNGLLGVAFSAFFGWILARSMLETKGIFWPWLIHMIADTVIFSFLAIGAVQLSG